MSWFTHLNVSSPLDKVLIPVQPFRFTHVYQSPEQHLTQVWIFKPLVKITVGLSFVFHRVLLQGEVALHGGTRGHTAPSETPQCMCEVDTHTPATCLMNEGNTHTPVDVIEKGACIPLLMPNHVLPIARPQSHHNTWLHNSLAGILTIYNNWKTAK